MFSTPEVFTDNSPLAPGPGPSMNVKNPSARKSLRQFYAVLDVKQKTSVCRLGVAKSMYKAIMAGIIFWFGITKRQVHTKIN